MSRGQLSPCGLRGRGWWCSWTLPGVGALRGQCSTRQPMLKCSSSLKGSLCRRFPDPLPPWLASFAEAGLTEGRGVCGGADPQVVSSSGGLGWQQSASFTRSGDMVTSAGKPRMRPQCHLQTKRGGSGFSPLQLSLR